MPLNARKDVQSVKYGPTKGSQASAMGKMRRKGRGDVTDASPVGVTIAATADNKGHCSQAEAVISSSPILLSLSQLVRAWC